MFLNAWNAAYGDRAIPDFLSVEGWDGMDAIFDVIKQTEGKFDGDQAMKILTNWKTDAQPARADLDRSGDARHHRERLYPARREA